MGPAPAPFRVWKEARVSMQCPTAATRGHQAPGLEGGRWWTLPARSGAKRRGQAEEAGNSPDASVSRELGGQPWLGPRAS